MKKNESKNNSESEKVVKKETADKATDENKKTDAEDAPKIIVRDRRFWMNDEVTPTESKELDERLPSYLERIKSQLDVKDKKLQEVIASLKEEQENFKKRVERDIDNRVSQVTMKLISGFLPALINIGRAIESGESTRNFDSLLEGIKMVKSQFQNCLKECGVEEISDADRPFNPKTDEAVQVVPVEEKEKDNIIINCLEPGFRLGEKVIRPAQVQVGKAA